MKKILLICGIIFGILLVLTPPIILNIYGIDEADSYPPPKVTYGEFPFKLVYKLNGEEHIVEDSVVCEYVRTEYDWNTGKSIVWNSYLASNKKEKDILITKDATRSIYCFVGDAEYYMGDTASYHGASPFIPHVYISSFIPDFPGSKYLSQEEILEKYNIEIVSWQFSDPIENSFPKESS